MVCLHHRNRDVYIDDRSEKTWIELLQRTY